VFRRSDPTLSQWRFEMGELMKWKYVVISLPLLSLAWLVSADDQPSKRQKQIGREVSIAEHMRDDDEFRTPLLDLISYGKQLFCANWTEQEGGGRPLAKGTGKPLSNPRKPLTGVRSFNRVSGPDANSCAGCHNAPFGIPGGGGDFATNVFVLGQRFDFLTFDPQDRVPTAGTLDEQGDPVTLQSVANLRSTPGLFGAGYLEMAARQITNDLQVIRDGLKPGESKPLVSKGISFGRIGRRPDGLWDTSEVNGLPRSSIISNGTQDPPNLVVRPWHQAGNAASLREFTNTSFNQHHGIQSSERFGADTDPDGDGFSNELTRADVTAATIYQAALPVPGRVIPNDPAVERAVLVGEKVFTRIGCASCHVPALPLDKEGWMFSEPSPYNPPGNLRLGETKTLRFDLNNPALPQPRLSVSKDGVVYVPAFTDFKLHDICDPSDEAERLDMNETTWSAKFREGNRKFLTRRLWGAANQPPYFHHGLFTTMRQAVLAHGGEAAPVRVAFIALTTEEQDDLIEFLKTLQVLPPGIKDLIVDENFHKREWPPAALSATSSSVLRTK
jgi:hypothetical protein